MPRGGRYRAIRTALWSEARFQKLSADARLLLLGYRTGSASSFAGISRVYTEQLEADTSLTPGEIRNANAELVKHGLVVADGVVVWVVDQLATDPAVEKAGGTPNEDQRKGIETHLATLPQDSGVLRKFKRHYGFQRRTVPTKVSPTVLPMVSPTVMGGPEKDTEKDTERGSGKGMQRENQPPTALFGVASSAESNGVNEREATETRTFGRPLTYLERNGRHPLPSPLRPATEGARK